MAQDRTSELGKGPSAEHRLAEYFRRLGYFVVRGILVRESGYDVTDLDLFLYNRQSPIGRERINVDAKNKRTPQAMERLFWALGLRDAYGLDRCIVATTDKRPVIAEFGRRLGVTVLDGDFLSRLTVEDDRLSDEELFELFSDREEKKLGGSWRERLSDAKSRLVTNLDFDGCNSWILDFCYFADQAMIGGPHRDTAYRLSYVCASYFLLALDYVYRELAFDEAPVRQRRLDEGFRHGADGARRTDEALSTALNLLAAVGARANEREVKRQLAAATEQVRADVLAEYFARNAVANNLFDVAKAIDVHAHARTFLPPASLSPDVRSSLSVLLDFNGLSRRHYFSQDSSRGDAGIL